MSEELDLSFKPERLCRHAVEQLTPDELAALSCVSLAFAAVEEKTLARLVTAPLVSLSLEGCRLPHGVCVLLGARLPLSLARLDLGGCFVGDAGLAALFDGGRAGGVARLSVALCELSSLAPLAASSFVMLDVSHNCLGLEGAAQIAQIVAQSPQLEELRCSAAGSLGDAGLRQVCMACSFAPLLRVLELAHVGATAACEPFVAESILACRALVSVTVAGNSGLQLTKQWRSDEGFRRNAASGAGAWNVGEFRPAANASELDLNGQAFVGAHHVQVMAVVAERCGELKVLRMDGCGLTDSLVLSAWPSYLKLLGSQLNVLSVCDNRLTAVSCELFLNAVRNVPMSIRIYGNAVPPANILELMAVCTGGVSAAALLRKCATSPGAGSPTLSAAGDGEFVRRATPNRALVPRPRHAPTVEGMAAKYGLEIGAASGASVAAPGGGGGGSGDDGRDETAALREDKQVLLSLYQRLVAEHAEVCLAYDSAVAKCKALGAAVPDLAAVKARAMQ